MDIFPFLLLPSPLVQALSISVAILKDLEIKKNLSIQLYVSPAFKTAFNLQSC